MDILRQINMLIPFLFLDVEIAIVARRLAKEKGRNVMLWTVLGAIPIVNSVCMCFFIGAANFRLARKIDGLLNRGGVDSIIGA